VVLRSRREIKKVWQEFKEMRVNKAWRSADQKDGSRIQRIHKDAVGHDGDIFSLHHLSTNYISTY